MNFDRNTIFGFIALAILFIGYFFYNSSEQKRIMAERAKQDSIARANTPKPDTASLKLDSLRTDSTDKIANSGDFGNALNGTEQLIPIENEVLKIWFSNKGGQPKRIEVK